METLSESHNYASIPSILIVDDHPADLRLLMELLHEQHFRVLIARDGQSGLDKAIYTRPDLILLDVKLPDMDGFQVCRQLKGNPTTALIPVIFITAEADAIEQKLQGFAVGGVDYITKPVQQEELFARVNVHLRLQALTRSLQEEIIERRQIAAELTRYQEQLEVLVSERTSALAQANAQLRQEIIDRIQTEQKLRQSEEQLTLALIDLQHERNQLQTIFESVGSGLALLDGHDRVVLANAPMAILLGSTSALHGRTWKDIDPTTTALIDAVRRSGTPVVQQKLNYGEYPVQRTINISVLPVPLTDTFTERILIHIVDVTDQMHLEALALQNERFAASGRLAASVAHEVNSPLQAIQNSLYVLTTVEEDQRTYFLNLIGDEIQRISAILRRLMDVQRPDNDTQSIDPHEVIERVLLLNSGKLAQQRIMVERDFDASVTTFQSRPNLLTQILLNLVLNAMDAMLAGGVLRLGTSLYKSPATELTLQIWVTDTGVGIDPAIKDFIFEPFYTTKSHGTGIGLAITQQLVHELGGIITVESTLGVGSRFLLDFPLTISA